MSETKPEPLVLFWLPGQKPQAMERWATNVMRDQRTTRGEIKVAWALSFAFNDKDARAWPTHETLATTVGLSSDSVREAIRGLVRNGHLLRQRELVFGKSMVVSRPAMNTKAIHEQSARPRKGGEPFPTPLGNLSSPKVGNPSTPCIPDLSGNDPLHVQGVSSGREPVILDDDLEVHAPRAVNRRTG